MLAAIGLAASMAMAGTGTAPPWWWNPAIPATPGSCSTSA